MSETSIIHLIYDKDADKLAIQIFNCPPGRALLMVQQAALKLTTDILQVGVEAAKNGKDEVEAET